jgi:hypothetical protein
VAVEGAFGSEIDYATITRLYCEDLEAGKRAERRYSPAKCLGVDVKVVQGDPDPQHVSTATSSARTSPYG